jgi:hypothetical protein
MNMPYNAFEINQARIQQMLEGDNRQRLADIARAGQARHRRIVKIVNAFQSVLGSKQESSTSTPLMNEVALPTSNG